MTTKPTLPKGTRDFGPEIMVRRNFIIKTIKKTFEEFGFQPLETPAMENLSVLTGKYGDEGDQLLYRLLNSGDYLKKVKSEDLEDINLITSKIADKGLRYDLTVPFARFVSANRHELTMPFKRYQIQPVWRADRPQKGRYREFYQCDADVVGTESLLCEIEILWMIEKVFKTLGIKDFTIKINHRKILEGITESIEKKESLSNFSVAIDKIDKIGFDKVEQELQSKGFSGEDCKKAFELLQVSGDNSEKINKLKSKLSETSGKKGLDDIDYILNTAKSEHSIFDPMLARGLSYYTGTIFEVSVNGIKMGSVSGGGRYDDLTGIFGLNEMSGIGFSFGIDRIYDSMEELDLFPKNASVTTKILIVHFDEACFRHGLDILKKLREAGISSEIYPDNVKIQKQFKYGNKKNIPFTIVIGEEEIKSNLLTVKEMETGKEFKTGIDDLIEKLK